jgi:hypothetical protein
MTRHDLIKLDKLINALSNDQHPLNAVFQEFKFFENLAGTEYTPQKMEIWAYSVAQEILNMRQDIKLLAQVLADLSTSYKNALTNSMVQEYQISMLRTISSASSSAIVQIQMD